MLRRGRGWPFIDLACLGSNTARSYVGAALRIVLCPLACAAVLAALAVAGLAGASLDVLTRFLPIVAAGAAVAWGVRRSHRRPWRSLVAADLRIDPVRLALGAAAEFALLAAQLALLRWLTGWPLRFALPAALWAFVLALALIPLQAASEEILFRGYLTQALGRLVPSRVAIAAIVALVFGLLHLNAYGPLTLPYFFVLSLVFSLVSLRDERLELAIGGHAAMNLFAFAAAGSVALRPATIGLAQAAGSFNPAAVAFLIVHGALFYGLTRLLVRLVCTHHQ